MLKNSVLCMKKNIGKTLLIFVIMFLITNLVIAGFSIKSASTKSVESIKETLGNDVTLSVDFRNMMKNRQPGEAVNETQTSLTITQADQLKGLKYVKNYNYTISTNVDTSLTAVENESSEETNMPQRPQQETTSDFSLQAISTMKYISDFTDDNYSLLEGRLLTEDDQNTTNCVIETNLAEENNLEVGDTFTMSSSSSSKELKIVGIYEIKSASMDMQRMNSNPVNTIYAGLSIGQAMTGSDTNLSSATYYLDNPENVDAFKELAKKETDIDFETFTLDSNDRMYQNNVSSFENISSFASLFLIVVIVAGCAIICLILALTIRHRYFEIGIFLSLGQSKIKIIGQQLIEIGLIAAIAFVLSLGTGQITSHLISSMLEDNQQQEMVMDMDHQKTDQTQTNQKSLFNKAMQAPENKELDVSLSTDTVGKLAMTSVLVCIVSTLIPTIYILRLSPREILTRKEG